MSYVLIRFSNPPKQRKSVKFFAIVFAETRTRDSLKIPEKWGFSGAWDMPAPSNAWGKT